MPPGVRAVFTAGDLGPLGAAGVNPLVPGLSARSFCVLDEACVETAARGVGEAGCIGVPAAIVNAAVDALARFGVTRLDPPLTAETLW